VGVLEQPANDMGPHVVSRKINDYGASRKTDIVA